MAVLQRAYDGLVLGFAALAGAVLFLIFVAIVWDVVLRNAGFRPPEWTSAGSEYGMLIATLMAGPWLVRIKAHVAIESLISVLPVVLQRGLSVFSHLLCAALSAVLCCYAAVLTW